MPREQVELIRGALLGRETPEHPVGDAASRSAAPSDANLPALVEQRPKPTDPAVRKWFRDRVNTWPDDRKAPGEDADWEAIKKHFAPGLSRNEDFRPARKQETPSGWRKQGQRSLWGVEKKSAGNSAVPPRQK
jgi:hypothetical protein